MKRIRLLALLYFISVGTLIFLTYSYHEGNHNDLTKVVVTISARWCRSSSPP